MTARSRLALRHRSGALSLRVSVNVPEMGLQQELRLGDLSLLASQALPRCASGRYCPAKGSDPGSEK